MTAAVAAGGTGDLAQVVDRICLGDHPAGGGVDQGVQVVEAAMFEEEATLAGEVAEPADHLACIVDAVGKTVGATAQCADIGEHAVVPHERGARIQFRAVRQQVAEADDLVVVVDGRGLAPRARELGDLAHGAVAVEERRERVVRCAADVAAADHVALAVDAVGAALEAVHGAEVGGDAVLPADGVAHEAVFGVLEFGHADHDAVVVQPAGRGEAPAGNRGHHAAAIEEAVVAGMAGDLAGIVDAERCAAAEVDVGGAVVQPGVVAVRADDLAGEVDVPGAAVGAGQDGDGVARVGGGEQRHGQEQACREPRQQGGSHHILHQSQSVQSA